MKSIRLKLMSGFTLVIFLITAVLGVINITNVSNIIEKDAYSELEMMAVTEANYIHALVETDLKYLEGLAQNGMILDTETPWEEKVSFLKKHKEQVI